MTKMYCVVEMSTEVSMITSWPQPTLCPNITLHLKKQGTNFPVAPTVSVFQWKVSYNLPFVLAFSIIHEQFKLT